jgi:branched-chain amino acid aminotransferase
MAAALDVKIEKVQHSRLANTTLENIPFGRVFTDHMLEADYIDGAWTNINIRPYQPLQFDPSLAALHYGQSIFEGVKAYKNEAGEVNIFRPQDNFRRFNISAARMCMPSVPENIFLEGMRQLIDIDRDWIPALADHSLYIRPFMFATDPVIGVKPSDSYKFMILLSPTGPYYSAPMKIYVEETYTRAAPGGVGFAKNAGNYGGSMLATQKAKEAGYDQVLWTDAFEHKYLQEVGTMNVFFVLGNKVVTPELTEGTILEGVTRDSAITVLKEMGMEVQEVKITIDELIAFQKQGLLNEVFGTGTAATISKIKELRYKDYSMHFDTDHAGVAHELKNRLTAIRHGETTDTHHWLFKV